MAGKLSYFLSRATARVGGIFGSIAGIYCGTFHASADGLFVSFYNENRVGVYDAQTGGLISGNFASIMDPLGLAIGADRNLYVASDNLASGNGAGIVRFAINGSTAGPASLFVDHSTDFPLNNSLNNPQGLAFRNGNLQVAEATTGAILTYDQAGTHIGEATSANPTLSAPYGLTLGPGNKIYVADENTGNVLSFDGTSFTQINSPGAFNAARDVVTGRDGNLYVLDAGGSSGIYKLSLGGASDNIIDYSTSLFQASNLAFGPDGKLYVSGQDLGSNEGEILKYDLDGNGHVVSVNVFADTGFGTSPGYMVFDVPEPSAWALIALAGGLCMFARRMPFKSARGF